MSVYLQTQVPFPHRPRVKEMTFNLRPLEATWRFQSLGRRKRYQPVAAKREGAKANKGAISQLFSTMMEEVPLSTSYSFWTKS